MRTRAFIGSVLLCLAAQAQMNSPFNGLPVPRVDSTGHYRFIVSGHFYGNGLSKAGYPAVTLLANLDTINTLGASFLLATGDLFIDSEADRSRYTRSFFSKLHMPLFNAVGNHDTQGDHYTKLYGNSSGTFTIGPDRVIILDTERDDSNVKDDQLKMIADAATEAENGTVRNVFILSHRPVWAEDDERYSPLFPYNTRSLTGTNFKAVVWPLLERIALKGKVFWIAGSMGGSAPASLFHDEPQKNIHYLMSAIRDEPRDALLIADVDASGVTWSGLSLTGQKLMPVADYSPEWWRKHLGTPTGFSWKLFPYYVKTTVLHRAFWSGILATLALVFVVWRIRRRRA